MAQIRRSCPYSDLIFWPCGLTIFVGTQENIIYRLLVRNPSWGFFFQFSLSGPLLAGKWAWPPCVLLMVWGLLTRRKSCQRYLKIMFSKFSGVKCEPHLKRGGQWPVIIPYMVWSQGHFRRLFVYEAEIYGVRSLESASHRVITSKTGCWG